MNRILRNLTRIYQVPCYPKSNFITQKREFSSRFTAKKIIGSMVPPPPQIIICITTTALFDCNDSHDVWERSGLEAYQAYQRSRIAEPMCPGVAFSLVKSLLALNEVTGKNFFDVVLISRIDGESGERVRNSIVHHDLAIRRMSFTAGSDVIKYLKAWKCDLFLSTEEEQVRAALACADSDAFDGIAAGLIYDKKHDVPASLSTDSSLTSQQTADETRPWPEGQVRIAFDGDGVLFSDQAERVFHEHGLVAFNTSEQDKGHIPLPHGPLHNFAIKLQTIRSQLEPDQKWRIRTFLVTARAKETTKRVYSTLREWDLEIDEKHFLGGLDKTPFLRTINPAIFFDDSSDHINRAKNHVPSAHVVYGTKNVKPVVTATIPKEVESYPAEKK